MINTSHAITEGRANEIAAELLSGFEAYRESFA